MANPNPHPARAAKRRRRLQSMGDITDLKRKVWVAVVTAAQMLEDEDAKPDLKLRAVHAVTQAAASYAKLIEATEFEARIAELEKKLEEDR
jgi:hypothetical protein